MKSFKDPSDCGGEGFQQYSQSILTLLTDTEKEITTKYPLIEKQ